MRPPHYWNFFEDGPEDLRVKHVLRYNADPCSAYSDGRVEAILQNIMEIGNNLKGYEAEKWKLLMTHVNEIFDHDFKEMQKKMSN